MFILLKGFIQFINKDKQRQQLQLQNKQMKVK